MTKSQQPTPVRADGLRRTAEAARSGSPHPAPGEEQSAGSEAFLGDVLAGLAHRPRSLPSRWFYDARGSQLFQWITRLPGYYLTRAEHEILSRFAHDILAPLDGPACTVVDLGAGDGHKTRLLLRTLTTRVPEVNYAPVDVSPSALKEAGERIREELPSVSVLPLQASWGDALAQLSRAQQGAPRLLLFLGSSIGNLEHPEALELLGLMRRALRPGDHVLIGFDLLKPIPLLLAAYDDPQGLTRAFNLNLLLRMNRELGAGIEVDAFRHLATFDPTRPAMESWLEAMRPQRIRLAGLEFRVEAGDRIHTEISCKYTDAQISGLAERSGFAEVVRYRDARGYFADALWRVE